MGVGKEQLGKWPGEHMNLGDAALIEAGGARKRIPFVGRVLAYACLAVVLASWFSSSFGVRGFLPNYAGDLFGSLMLYLVFRQEMGWPAIRRVFSPAFSAVFVFGGCSAIEFAQRRNWFPGTFDPIDLGCYAIGAAIGLILDRWIVPPARR